MILKNYGPYYETPGDKSSGSTGQPASKDEMQQDLQDIGEDTKTEEGEDDDGEGKSLSEDDGETGDVEEEGTDKEAEDKEGEEEEKQEGEEEELPDGGRTSVRQIKAKYPNLFKDFPQLRSAFFEHPKYQEIFADVDSAREAAGKSEEYDALEESLVNRGDPGILLKTLAENNPKALKEVVRNFADSVRQVDPDIYVGMTTPIIEELLYHATAHANKIQDNNLRLAARHLANFVFANGGDIPDITKRNGSPRRSEAEVQLERERATYAQEKYETALTDVVNIVSPEMDKLLKVDMEGLTPFEQKQIIKESRVEIDNILKRDKGFQASLTKLWQRAAETGYSAESKTRIRRAWLDRARLLAPSIRNKLKQEALSARKEVGREKRGTETQGESKVKFKMGEQKRTFPEKGGTIPEGRQRTVLDPKKIDWRKTSDRDILDSK